jgi:hypothetical protein
MEPGTNIPEALDQHLSSFNTWMVPCPLCKEAAGNECTSPSTGCTVPKGHSERLSLQLKAVRNAIMTNYHAGEFQK